MFLLKPSAPVDFHARFPEYPRVIRDLLWQRGILNEGAVDEFFHPDYGEDLHDPFLLSGMARAIERISDAIGCGEKILVYGDYDADGVCASAILITVLRKCGADVEVYLPNRNSEGYGLTRERIEACVAEGVGLIITIDTGITFGEEVALAEAAGVNVVICDHHLPPPVLPRAYAIVDPKLPGDGYPFKHLAAAGVAFKVVQALMARGGFGLANGSEKLLLDLVAVATIADVMPLLGENRTLVTAGLYILAHTTRPGLKALIEVSGITPKVLGGDYAAGQIPRTNLDADAVGFQLAPRLNAASRLDHANTSLELVMTADPSRAAEIAQKLDEKNRERQRIVDDIAAEIEVTLDPAALPKIIIAGNAEWQPGILGLVAGRLKDKFYRPAIIYQRGPKESRGSCRSIEAFNIVEAMRQCGDIFTQMGGHPRAAGFSIASDKLDELEVCLGRTAEAWLKPEDLAKPTEADVEISSSEFTWELADWVERLEPFGEGNPEPKLVMRNLDVVEARAVGANGKHLKLTLRPDSDPRRFIKAIAFGQGNGSTSGQLAPGDRVDACFAVSVNEWNGSRELEMKVTALAAPARSS
ncbi:single-stranded-DNA-specific exonuclease RecJ [Candidatus Parcubacteria bacterium]|nr:single-stranded-DNA-specific exonuclease RecJ [Candidatus Parcubacteria bacterium]